MFGKIVPLGTQGALTGSLCFPNFGMVIEHGGHIKLTSLCGYWYLRSNQGNIFKHEQKKQGSQPPVAAAVFEQLLVFTSASFYLLAYLLGGNTGFFHVSTEKR